MRKGRPKANLELTPEEVAQLTAFMRSRSLPASLVQRSLIVLECAKGHSDSAIAEQLGLSNQTIGKWRRRFMTQRMSGLYDAVRPGRPRTIGDEKIAQLLQKTLHSTPKDGATHWSVRAAGAEVGISKSTVQRMYKIFGIQPHRHEEFKLSTDPFFIEKVRDVVGLYLNPPENAIVLSIDEKSQCQALERSQPVLPLGFGYVEGITHNYKRHGTTTLFAALDVLCGHVIGSCKPKHRHQEFLSFLREIDKQVPSDLDIHCIVDNYATHKHQKVKAWLAARPRWQMHFIPTYSSWLNQVERFFGIITGKVIRRGTFKSVKDLTQKIDHFIDAYNEQSQPFKWTATADSVFEKLERLCIRINGSSH